MVTSVSCSCTQPNVNRNHLSTGRFRGELRFLASAIEHAGEAVIITDAGGSIEYVARYESS